MDTLQLFLLSLGTLILSHTSFGEEQIMFLQKYKGDIQNYIMTGHENGWKQCDILSDGFSLMEIREIGENIPHVSMELNKMVTMNAKSVFASSSCLLVISHVASVNALNTIINFGKATFLHKRLALLLTMDIGINLHMATNITKLPFLVAAKAKATREVQFLCPVIGERDPRIKQEMCDPSYVSYKNKTFRVGIMGMFPYFVNSNVGHDGMDIRLLTMLEERLKFNAKIVVPPSFLDSVYMVCSLS